MNQIRKVQYMTQVNSLLEKIKSGEVRHGDAISCPCCHNPDCILDTETPAGDALADNATWYNHYQNTFECGECWLK
jgi:hypothetical protein